MLVKPWERIFQPPENRPKPGLNIESRRRKACPVSRQGIYGRSVGSYYEIDNQSQSHHIVARHLGPAIHDRLRLQPFERLAHSDCDRIGRANARSSLCWVRRQEELRTMPGNDRRNAGRTGSSQSADKGAGQSGIGPHPTASVLSSDVSVGW